MVKSPLAQAFGLALYGCRKKLKLTTDSIANAIETTPTYYKAVESGAHNLHVSKAYLLCKAFTANGKDSILSLPSVLHILGFISMLELACNKSDPKDQNEFASMYYQNFIDFTSGQNDLRMKYIREQFEIAGIFEMLKTYTSKEINKIIAERKLDIEVLTFIDRPGSKAETANPNLYDYFASEFFEKFPTFYIGHLLDVKNSLKKLPIKYDYRSSWLWEKDHTHKIVKVFGICTSKEFLVQRLSLRKYDYSYFSGDLFKEMKFIILDDRTSADNIKIELEEELLICLEQQLKTVTVRRQLENAVHYDAEIQTLSQRVNNIKNELYKVRFKVSGDHLINIEDLLTKPIHKMKFNTFWVFELDGGYYMGIKAFILKRQWRLQDAEYLTFGETKRLVQYFETCWNNI